MKKYIVLALFASTLLAQAPQQPKPNEKQQAIIKEAEPLQKQLADLYKKLESNEDFQKYTYLQNRLQELQTEYNATQTQVEVKPKTEK